MRTAHDVGTASLVLDLPLDYRAMSLLRRKPTCCGSAASVWLKSRAWPSTSPRRSKHLLIQMFNFLYIYARRAMSVTDLVVEVTPSHARYYGKLLS